MPYSTLVWVHLMLLVMVSLVELVVEMVFVVDKVYEHLHWGLVVEVVFAVQ